MSQSIMTVRRFSMAEGMCVWDAIKLDTWAVAAL
jgi:hypothetical protein